MSTTILIPVAYGFIRNEDGDLVLHPSIKPRAVIIEANGCIRCESKLQFTLGDGHFYDIELGRNNKDDFFHETIIFTGFYSTAMSIIEELNVPSDEVEWVK